MKKTIQQHQLLILTWKIKIGRITDASWHTILHGISFGDLWENTKVTVSFHSCEKLYPKTAANHSINPIFITVISIDRKCLIQKCITPSSASKEFTALLTSPLASVNACCAVENGRPGITCWIIPKEGIGRPRHKIP